jgi:hypothetical protein
MSKEDKTNQDDIPADNGGKPTDTTVDDGDDKKTNKTYDQSEFDKEVAKREQEIKLKYKDHDELKEKYEELEKWKQEKELAEMSESEKNQKLIEELKNSKTDLESQLNAAKLENLKNSILSTGKWVGMPRAYKKLVHGETQEEIELNAEKIFEEYRTDFIVKGDNVGIPDISKDGGGKRTTPLTPVEKIKEALARKAKERGTSL